MNKKSIAAVIVILALTMGLIMVNKTQSQEQTLSYEEGGITVLSDGEFKIGLDISDINDANPIVFEAEFKKKVGDPKTMEFEGVLLKDLIDVSNGTSIDVTSVDNYNVTLTISEVLEDGNVYIVTKQDGEELGYMADGGGGPFMLVVVNDDVSTRWSKCVATINILN